MGRTCGTYGGQKKCINSFDGETSVKETTWEIYLRWEDNINIYVQEEGWGGVDSLDITQDRDKWRALLNAAMTLRVS
jgi:hypothetical protein